jgi:hypothetical protein
MHYALRPWPWILVALASLVVFPDVASLQARFPQLTPEPNFCIKFLIILKSFRIVYGFF